MRDIDAAHAELLSAIAAYVGRTYTDTRGLRIDRGTRFDALSFSLLDEAWVQHLVTTIYAIPDLAPDPWPETVGGVMDAIESRLSDGGGFSDEAIAYISFAGGACGHAMRYLLLLSPDAAGLDGNAINMVARSGSLHGVVGISGIGLALNSIPADVGLPPSAWYDHAVYPHLISHARSLIDRNGASARARLPLGRWVWADHAPPSRARFLFPNAGMVALRRNPADLARDFILKNGMEPVDDESMQVAGLGSGTTNIDHQVGERSAGGMPTRDGYRDRMLDQLRYQMRMQDMICDDAARLGCHIVDVDRLLDPASWHAEYTALVTNLSMSPDYDRAGEFLRFYAGKQYDRNTWTPSPDWNWVKLGPKIPGRW